MSRRGMRAKYKQAYAVQSEDRGRAASELASKWQARTKISNQCPHAGDRINSSSHFSIVFLMVLISISPHSCSGAFAARSRTELKRAVDTCLKPSPKGDCSHGPIGSWDVSRVTDMSRMFADAKLFRADVSKWDVSKVGNMFGMFRHATSFNGEISKWDVSRVAKMDHMFSHATLFNRKLCGAAWVGSKATKLGMFSGSPGSISRTVCTATAASAFSPQSKVELKSAVNELALCAAAAATAVACGVMGQRDPALAEESLASLPPDYQAVLKEAIDRLRPEEAAMHKRWYDDDDEDLGQWRKLPPRDWPLRQPSAGEVPGLRAKLEGLNCDSSTMSDPGKGSPPSQACATASFHLATALVFGGVDPREGHNRYLHLARWHAEFSPAVQSEGQQRLDNERTREVLLDSIVAVGVMLVEGMCVDESGTFYEDTDLGVQYLRQGVDAGSAQAHFELGKLLYCGQDVEEDEKEAFELFQMAAEQGHVGAQFMAADMLLHSGMANGPNDMARAVDMLYGAAEKGHRFARQNMRVLFKQYK